MDIKEQHAFEEARRRINACLKDHGEELDLRGIGLTEIPKEIGELKHITKLVLADNLLTVFPPELGNLRTLKRLNAAGNNFRFLPAEIGNLSALEIVSFANNDLEQLPGKIGKLTRLSKLNLAGNQLTSLPVEIGNLLSLVELDLQNNLLVSLPFEMSKLPALLILFLHGNPALEFPIEVLGPTWEDSNISFQAEPASSKAILDFYFERIDEGVRPLCEVKLILVGRGETGKTSLSRCLRGQEFLRDQRETPGIDIRPWNLRVRDTQVRVHLWDLAGQEITHETHRFFLTSRSLYLVVLDGRGGQQTEEAEYWLRHVDKYGAMTRGAKEGQVEKSPVIVVLNKWRTSGPYELEKRLLERKFPNIQAFIETDCATALGIPALSESISRILNDMPMVWQNWPRSYFRVRHALAELGNAKSQSHRRHFLSWEDYQAICVRSRVTDRDKQESLAENLNALGVALYYGDHERLRDTRILNPNWAANGLYGIIRGVQRKPFRGRSGELWAGSVDAVLAEGMKGMDRARSASIKDYPSEQDGVNVHEFLINLVQDRELGFRAGDFNGKPFYLLPGLLALDEPDPAKYDIAQHIAAAELRFRYEYELLPSGVISRLIVRTYTLGDGTEVPKDNKEAEDNKEFFRWKNGVVLKWKNARALVISERIGRRIDVFILGGTQKERQELAGIVRSNMLQIHEDLPEGLRGKEHLDLSIPGDQYESVSKLEKLEANHQDIQVVTTEGSQNLPVTPELEQLQPKGAREPSAPRFKVFVCYAHSDNKLWDKFKVHLNILQNEGLVSWWFDRMIVPGAAWDDVVRRKLMETDIFVLLVSNHFFASDYIQSVELQAARERVEEGGASILPVLLETCPSVENHPWLKSLHFSPIVDGRPRALRSFNPSINGWSLVQVSLRKVIEELAERRKE